MIEISHYYFGCPSNSPSTQLRTGILTQRMSILVDFLFPLNTKVKAIKPYSIFFARRRFAILTMTLQGFITYIARFSHDPKKVLVFDLDSSHGIYLGYLNMNMAKLI